MLFISYVRTHVDERDVILVVLVLVPTLCQPLDTRFHHAINGIVGMASVYLSYRHSHFQIKILLWFGWFFSFYSSSPAPLHLPPRQSFSSCWFQFVSFHTVLQLQKQEKFAFGRFSLVFTLRLRGRRECAAVDSNGDCQLLWDTAWKYGMDRVDRVDLAKLPTASISDLTIWRRFAWQTAERHQPRRH